MHGAFGVQSYKGVMVNTRFHETFIKSSIMGRDGEPSLWGVALPPNPQTPIGSLGFAVQESGKRIFPTRGFTMIHPQGK